MADNLYGGKQTSKTKLKQISSSNALTFSSNLSALISKSASGGYASAGRPPASKGKSDIFRNQDRYINTTFDDNVLLIYLK